MQVYTSSYSAIEVEPEKKLLRARWFAPSSELNEEGVIAEISKILDFTKSYSITSILVDSRNYPFRENENIQYWINHTYMPQIIDHGILRYAILVKEKVQSIFDDFQEDDDVEDDIVVEYFTNMEEAERWLTSVS